MFYYFIHFILWDFLLFGIHCGQRRKHFIVQGNMFPYCAYCAINTLNFNWIKNCCCRANNKSLYVNWTVLFPLLYPLFYYIRKTIITSGKPVTTQRFYVTFLNQACVCSAFIPVYCGLIPPTLQGVVSESNINRHRRVYSAELRVYDVSSTLSVRRKVLFFRFQVRLLAIINSLVCSNHVPHFLPLCIFLSLLVFPHLFDPPTPQPLSEPPPSSVLRIPLENGK